MACEGVFSKGVQQEFFSFTAVQTAVDVFETDGFYLWRFGFEKGFFVDQKRDVLAVNIVRTFELGLLKILLEEDVVVHRQGGQKAAEASEGRLWFHNDLLV